MTITFSAEYIDLKKSRHVSVRRKGEDVDLAPMPTDAEIAQWDNREIKTHSRRMYTPISTDDVEARRNAEKAAADAKARARLAAESEDPTEEFRKLSIRSGRNTSAEQKIIADTLRLLPGELTWSTHLNHRNSFELLEIAHRCAMSTDPKLAWAINVALLRPRESSPERICIQQAYYSPEQSRFNRPRSIGWQAKRSDMPLVTEWMRAAERNEIPGRQLVCAISGKSLIRNTTKAGRKYWYIDKTIEGISLDMAQHVVSAAAIQAGFSRGSIRGTVPEIVNNLKSDPSRWLGMAIASKHPMFYHLASELVRKDILTNKTDKESLWKEIISAVNVYHGEFR